MTTARARCTILAPIESVYDAIVSATTVASYFPDRATGDLVEGAQVTWEFDHANAQVHLRVTAVEQPTRVVFDWDTAGTGYKTVEFDLVTDDTAHRPGSR